MNEVTPSSKYSTPITDAIRDKYAGDPSCEDYRSELEETCVNLERQLAKVTEQRDQLERWKREQLEVDSSWEPQEVGRLLGMTLGADIRANIKPRIEKLIEQRDTLIDAIDHILGDSTTFLTNVCIEKAQAALASVKGDNNE